MMNRVPDRVVRLAPLAWLLVLFGACGARDETPADTGDDDASLPLGDHAPLLSCAEPVVSPQSLCARDADCSGDARCVAAEPSLHDDRAPLPLACGAPLGTGRNRDRCLEATDCESGLCALSGVCLVPCQDDGDCVTGQACTRVEARWNAGLEPVMACARTLAFPSDVTVRAPLGDRLPRDVITTLSLPVIEGDALMFVRASCDSVLEVRALRERSGHSLYSLSELFAGLGAENPLTNVGALVPMLVPNNPALRLSGSPLEIDLRASSDTDIELIVVSRAGEHDILDLNLYYVGGGEERLDGGLHPGSEAMREVIERVRARLSQIGIRLGELREHDVLGALRNELSVLETEIVRDENGNAIDLRIEGLDRLFGLSAGSDDGGVNLFLVSDMQDILGISGGIPGGLGVPGTSVSGVAVAVDVVGLAKLDNVILHEMSHQLGLFHTSELDGFLIEPLDDTPVCGTAQDENADGILSPAECEGHGAENLMFWAGSGTELSPRQIELLHRSAVLR